MLDTIIHIILCTIGFIVIFGFWNLKRPNKFPPGPYGIPIFGYVPFLGNKTYSNIGKIGEKYGNIFSIKMGSYWFVILNDFETIKSALKLDVFSGRPNFLLRMSFYKKGIAFNQGPHWKEQRIFSTKVLRDFGFGKVSMVTSVQEEVIELVEYLRSQNGEPFALLDILPVSIINALWHILTGEKFQLNDPFPRNVYAAIRGGLASLDVKSNLSLLSWYAALRQNSDKMKKVRIGVDKMSQLLKPTIQNHIKEYIPGTTPRDYIDMYLQQISKTNDESSSFYKSEGELNLMDSLINFFNGGSNTLTNSLGFAMLYLATYRNALDKIHEEIDRVIGRKRIPDPSDRLNMPYTEAAFYEILRVSSIFPGNLLHSTTEDIKFMGYNLPKDTIIMPNLYEVHHDKKYWGDPENFRPERFLTSDGKTFIPNERVIAFSIGKRVCMGEELAIMEFFLFFTGILQTFDLIEDPCYPLPNFEPHIGFQLSPKPYKLIFKNRINST